MLDDAEQPENDDNENNRSATNTAAAHGDLPD
jgi:hypothetical protein